MSFQKGFKAVAQEQERREKEKEKRSGALWRIFFGKDDQGQAIPIHFITDEPVCFNEHNIRPNGKLTSVLCTADQGDCPHCDAGDRPSYKGAFLVIDHREVEVDERDKSGTKTGKKKIVTDRIKLLVRGVKDLQVLAKKKERYGLKDILWEIEKTGENTSTLWSFEKADEAPISQKEVIALLPDAIREEYVKLGKFDAIRLIEDQILATADDTITEGPSAEDVEEKVNSKVQRVGQKPGLKKPETTPTASKLGKKKPLATASKLKRK